MSTSQGGGGGRGGGGGGFAGKRGGTRESTSQASAVHSGSASATKTPELTSGPTSPCWSLHRPHPPLAPRRRRLAVRRGGVRWPGGAPHTPPPRVQAAVDHSQPFNASFHCTDCRAGLKMGLLQDVCEIEVSESCVRMLSLEGDGRKGRRWSTLHSGLGITVDAQAGGEGGGGGGGAHNGCGRNTGATQHGVMLGASALVRQHHERRVDGRAALRITLCTPRRVCSLTTARLPLVRDCCPASLHCLAGQCTPVPGGRQGSDVMWHVVRPRAAGTCRCELRC